MRVTVLTPSRTKMLLEEVDTLRDVKRQITARTGIPARQQLVYFKGRQLKSLRRPLDSYCVRDGATLYLVKRLGVCRCLACRNSRYIEREEAAEERLQLLRLLAAPAEGAGARAAEEAAGLLAGAELELSAGTPDRPSDGADGPARARPAGIAPEDMEGAAEGNDDGAGAEIQDLEEDGEELEDADGATDDAEEAEEPALELEDAEEDGEEAMDAVAGETEDLSEEPEDADEELELELSGEELEVQPSGEELELSGEDLELSGEELEVQLSGEDLELSGEELELSGEDADDEEEHEEEPDLAELEDEEPAAVSGGGPPEPVRDLLLAMTRPTPAPEDAEDSQEEEQYPEDDPLFDPPDEEDPLLAPAEHQEDAGYMSGDEMDRP
ncbi:sodium/potassium/calcium exchanger 1-like [Amphibalanus amphitrite]|uniref:sodium/potassium/calcium exchanger 1-like n=1 Tax=Amphibalanus amphitrite TaxID=1232801 RepID=UPI001C91C5E5|nr:sodium/potassium/calcium exchanger 1-like [Amphibalanus amphitrite]XP_043235177.1 sodium/potassium/calcium exchanger 1-like [Amphibalanus amphitrite]